MKFDELEEEISRRMNTREHIHLPRHIGDRVADKVTAGMGSWRFVIILTIILILWIMFNSIVMFAWKWDPYPFIALNLGLSCLAAYASPLILMSQNRQAGKDRERDKIEQNEVQQMYDTHNILLDMNEQQLELLKQQATILDMLRGGDNAV